MTALDREGWATLLAQLDDPPLGTVAEALADARDLDILGAYDVVEEAIADGDLVEEDTGAAFGAVRLADETPEPAEPADMEPRGAGSPADDPEGEDEETGEEKAVEALRDVLAFYNARVDDTIGDHTEDGDHPERPTTAREYFTEVRGWNDDTVDDLLLGWAPPDHSDELVAYLHDRGHDRDAILATGAVGETDSGGFYTTFQGRYVLPYYDADGEPAYAIARVTGGEGGGAKGYGGHPRDYQAGKYAKLRHTDDRVPFDEPIYGLDTLDEGAHVVVAEGIADAITAREMGCSVLSPVAKEFKEAHYDPLAEALDDHGVGRMTIVADADGIRNDDTDEHDPETIGEAVSRALSPVGAGLAGSLRTATKLGDRTETDIRVTVPPAPAALANDLDEFVNGSWNGDLDALLASAKPADTYAEYEAATAGSSSTTEEERNTEGAERSGDGSSALWDLDLSDLESLEDGDRTKNPFSHTGDSETYFVARRQAGGDVIAKDYKAKGGGQTYNALTGLLVDAGKRRRDDPEGSLSDAEVFHAWRQAKVRNDLADDDPVPYRGIVGIAVEDDLVADEELVERDADTGEVAEEVAEDTYQALPSGTYNDVLQHIREEYDVNPGREPATGRDGDGREDDDEHTDDARDLLGLDAVVEPGDAMRAARAVTPADLDTPLPELERDDVDDVAIAVALAEGVIDDPDTFPRDDRYTEAYYRARDVYGAPLPKYLDNSTLEERFDLVTAAVKRVGPEHILDDLRSEVTVENPPGEAVAKIDPTWEDSESGERIVAGYGSGFYCVKHGVSFDPIQLVALENDLILDETVYPTGEAYKQAYRLLREEYGAPIPRWRATVLEEVTVLPPAVRLANEDLSASVSFDLDEAREETETLVRDALTTRDRAQLVTVVPGGGKTFSTAIAAADHPILYAPPRNELKKQMEEYAAEIRESDEFDAEPDVYHLPILAENGLPDDAVEAAVAAVRSDGFDLLRDRETLLGRVEPYLEEDDQAEGDAVGPSPDQDDEEIDLNRATCPSAEGDHGEEWRVAVQTARALGLRPSEIHRYDQTLFGDELPCTEGGACEYTEGWDVVTDVERCPDILIGSAGHAFVDSATSYYTEDQDGHRVSEPRAVVVDEFPGDTYATEYGSRYMDHATWLAEALTGVETREELLDADLGSDTWVSEWLDGSGADVVVAGEAIDVLRAGAAIVDAGAAADRLLERGPVDLAGGATSANVRGVVATLEDLVETPPADVDVDAAIDTLDQYEYIIIDCPPYLGYLTDNGLYAAQNVLIPAFAESTSKRALELLFDHIETLELDYEISIGECGVVANRVEATNEATEMMQWFNEAFPDVPVWEVRKRVAFQRAFSAGNSIFGYKPELDMTEVFLDIAATLDAQFDIEAPEVVR